MIKKIQIDSVLGKKVTLDLFPDVTIFYGQNGSGKSTICEKIVHAFSSSDKKNGVSIFLDDGTQYREGEQQVHCKQLFSPTICFEYYPQKGGMAKFWSIAELENEVYRSDNEMLLSRLDEEGRDILVKTLNQFFDKDRFYKTGKSIRLFQLTQKMVSFVGFVEDQEDRLTFLTNDGAELEADQLSLGEKKLLNFFLHLILRRATPTLFLMDEPENSLHLEWQGRLLHVAMEVAPLGQFVAFTHSPGIAMDGGLLSRFISLDEAYEWPESMKIEK
ncbi:MAG: ABC transporter ATP-binding protein [Parcubacteria group bacterium Gr01-1014_18]|nr:MAG: ABC transporter ATP-binding protein [Parcubacteria group bacterium Greene0416_36]TSC79326.1 MAG: ABC transporter ATP-binding protein [Parcubacteria group bacterium Gr01-1014_18]TSD05949.1 MAG: ABC transporter ATP-binding protein [Parcubacteria group bacterium Greene0714_2]